MQNKNKPINVANAIFDVSGNFLLWIINLYLNKRLVDIDFIPKINALIKANMKILFRLVI